MKAPLIAAMLAMFAATALAATPTTPLASNDSLSKQFAHRDCKYLSKYRVATTALEAQPKGHERRGGAYIVGWHTLILGVAY